MGGLIDMEWRIFEMTGCWTHYVILNYVIMNFTLDFQGKILK